MTDIDAMARKLAVHYRCPSCSRCFVSVGGASADKILCACGAPLAPNPLPGGIYELRSAVPDDARATIPMQAGPPDGPVSVTFAVWPPARLGAH
jgi:hypothetical protein